IKNDLYTNRKWFIYRSFSYLPKVMFQFEKVHFLNFQTSKSTSP
ncbi:hypothetical protein HMPREF1555_00821, partial [Porphyromonas gingivalis F0570]